MSKDSYGLLMQLKAAKDEVKRLEAEYRKICACNERIPGTESLPFNVYTKTHKTCDYHTVRVMNYANV